MIREFFGPTSYSAPGAGFDPQNPRHWIGGGMLFDVDIEAKTSRPVSVLGDHNATHHHFHHQDGRTFVITSGMINWIQELLPDLTLKPLAAISSTHHWSFANNWQPEEEFLQAYRKLPGMENYSPAQGTPDHGMAVLWIDRNGDGKVQTVEFEFDTTGKNLYATGWGVRFENLTLRITGNYQDQDVLVTFQPDGYLPGGAPNYPSIRQALESSVPIQSSPARPTGNESAIDRQGNIIVNSDPWMASYSPDGKLRWKYPNRWSGVHGSHDAPLPQPGQLQGSLFFTGIAPLDESSDVFLINGNHGRAFLLTSDGLFLDEIFTDVRLSNSPQLSAIGILGGECFGGTFGRAEESGEFYFQGGGNEYRIYNVTGLTDTLRSHGNIEISPEQAIAAERNKTRLASEASIPRLARIPRIPTPEPGKDPAWDSAAPIKWKKDERFPVKIIAAHDGTTLFLNYEVHEDNSPWVNNGSDWQTLFKTGDSIDLQLGTDPSANPKRSSPVPGDLRLLIAPSQGQDIAVLYRHRHPDAREDESVVFQAPWRSEKVDLVRKVASAEISVKRDSNAYTVHAAIPLSELGLTAESFDKNLRADFGVIYGDSQGTANILRNYWANQSTGLVNDVPGEIMLSPNLWGALILEK